MAITKPNNNQNYRNLTEYEELDLIGTGKFGY